MHIKTEPCPEAGAREAYHVIICEDDDEESPASLLGHITRADDGANTWTLKFRSQGDKEREAETFEGANIDEVREAMEKRFAYVKISANRLGMSVMSRFVDDLMDPVIDLAAQTETVSPLILGLVHVMARVIAVNIPEAKHAALRDLIVKQLDQDLTGYVMTRESQKQFADTLRKKFEQVAGDGSIADLFEGAADEQTRKH